MDMTKEQEKRFRTDLERVAGCAILDITVWLWPDTNFSITVETELGAHKIAHSYQKLPATIKYLEHMKAWNVRIGD